MAILNKFDDVVLFKPNIGDGSFSILLPTVFATSCLAPTIGRTAHANFGCLPIHIILPITDRSFGNIHENPELLT
jgi:hypothetical protein